MQNFIRHNINVDKFRKELNDEPGQEPTFLTFSLEFEFEGMLDEAIGMHTSPLLHKAEDTYSAWNYLRSKKFTYEKARLEEFWYLLNEITNNAPWFYQSVSGIQTLWQNASNADDNFRGKDARLEVETLEGLDLRVSYLADLYRKFAYDSLYAREMLPENMRYFNVRVYVSEFRNLRDFVRLDPNYFTNNVSYICYDCRFCEFDFSGSYPANDSLSIHNPEMSSNKFAIKVGHFFERHNHPWFDNSTDETWNRHVREKVKPLRTVSTPLEIYGSMTNNPLTSLVGADPEGSNQTNATDFNTVTPSNDLEQTLLKESRAVLRGNFNTVTPSNDLEQTLLKASRAVLRGNERGFFHNVNQAMNTGTLDELKRLGQQAWNAAGNLF